MKINRSPSTYLKSSVMCSVILIIGVLIPFVRANCDETPAVVDPKYGKDMYCHFGYFGAADPNIMKKNSQLAQQFGQGQVKGYTIGFTTLAGGINADTLVKDSNGVVCGMAYLLPVSEFQKILQSRKTSDSTKPFIKFITVTVDVSKDGQQISMECYAMQVVTPPTGNEVACKELVQIAIDAYTAGHFSEDCMAKIKQIPTRQCECTPPP